MIRLGIFKKKSNIDQRLRDTRFYSIQSEIEAQTIYGIERRKFAIIQSDRMVLCDHKDIPSLIMRLDGDKLQEEVIEIYREIPELLRIGAI